MSDPLDRAIEALRAAPVPPGPPAELVAATVAAVAVRAKPLHAERRRRIMRIAGYGTAGTLAAGMLVAAGVLWVAAGSAQALEEALRKATEAKSVRVRMTVGSPGKSSEAETILRRGDVVRIERSSPVVYILNVKTREGLELDTGTKTGARMKLTESEARVMDGMLTPLSDLTARFAKADGLTVKALGAEAASGIAMYEVVAKGPPGLTWRVWVDPGTNLPARIETPGPNPDETMRLDFTDWNAEFDPKLFSLDAPADESTRGKGERFVVFRAAMDAAEKAKSFRAVVRTTMANPLPGMPPIPEQRIYGQGDKVRIEMGHVTGVGDAKKLITLDARAKTAETTNTPKQGNGIPAVAEAVGKLLAKDGADDLGERFLDGRKTRAYRVKGLDFGVGKADVTYWVDGKRDLPVRFEIAVGGPVAMTQTIDYLGFDEELDPKLFDMTIPEGYKVEAIDPTKLKPKP